MTERVGGLGPQAETADLVVAVVVGDVGLLDALDVHDLLGCVGRPNAQRFEHALLVEDSCGHAVGDDLFFGLWLLGRRLASGRGGGCLFALGFRGCRWVLAAD